MSEPRSPSPVVSDPQLKRAVRLHLLPWFEQHRRDLPWRRQRTPYRVWISESMLVQTRVDQVISYYKRFMKRFPGIRALAEAPLDDVLKQWEGLGYYARARNVHKAAQYIVNQLNGRFPRDYDSIKALPGIGPYMAAAIASLAYNQNHAVLDGNVIRVLSRLTAFEGDTSTGPARRDLQALAQDLLVVEQAGVYNEAVMELGALVCTPRQPKCSTCPLRLRCAAYAKDAATAYPRRRPKRAIPHKEVGAAVVVNRKGQVLIAQRLDNAMLGGLWEFPGGTQEPDETMPECVARELKEELGLTIAVGDRLMIVKHAYSHFTIALHVYMARIRSGRPRPIHCAAYRWCRIDELSKYAFSRADLHVVDRLRTEASALKLKRLGQ